MRDKPAVMLCLVCMFWGCVPGSPTPPSKFFLLFGDSQTSVPDAVGEAQLATNNAVANGYRPVSIGGGVGAANMPPVVVGGEVANPGGNGSVISVYVLVEGPANAPDLLPNGTRVP